MAAQMIATRDAYGEALAALGAENPRVVALDADLSGSTRSAQFGKQFPERFFNVGIAEANMVGIAAGLALTGKIPFASTFAIFGAGRAYDQVRNAICYPNLNVKIAVSHAGLTLGEDGASHQMIEDIALMRVLPNMTVLVPADAVEAKLMVKAAAAHVGPVYLRFGRPAVPVVFDDNYDFQIGKAPVLRDGSDVAIFACGIMVAEALAAADTLAAEGIEARVINVSSIKPIDVDTIVTAARDCGCAVTAEEHNVLGGMGSAVAEVLGEEQPVPLLRVGVKDTFGESGTPRELMEKYGLTATAVVAAARQAVAKKRR